MKERWSFYLKNFDISKHTITVPFGTKVDAVRDKIYDKYDPDVFIVNLVYLDPTKKCLCRNAKRHRDCAYCGYGGSCTHICGQCKLGGIDGPVIRGTEQRICKLHKRKTK